MIEIYLIGINSHSILFQFLFSSLPFDYFSLYMIKKYEVLETDRLRLKAVSLDDAKLVLDVLTMPKWKEFIGDRNINDEEDAITYIKERMLPQYEKIGYGNYCVIRKSDDAKMGFCGLYDREGLESVDIGFAILPEYEGKGYTYEAARCMLSFGFDTLGIKLIQGITSKENIASQRLLEKIGLESKGEVRLPNEDEDLLLYNKISD